MEENFSLQWNDFHSNLSEGFHSLLKSEDLVDVTLAAGNKYVQAHRLVLSVCSPYFKDLFKVNPCKHPTVILKGVAFQDLMNILEFMYRGQVNVQHDGLSDFLKTAEMLQVKGLCENDDSVLQKHTLAESSSSPTPTASDIKISTQYLDRKPQIKQVFQDTKSTFSSDEVSSPPLKRKRLVPLTQNTSTPPRVKEHLVVVSETYDDNSDEVEFVSVIDPKDEIPDDDEESFIEEGEIVQNEKSNMSNIFSENDDFSMHNTTDSQFETEFPSSSQAFSVGDGDQEFLLVLSAKGKEQLVHNNFLYCLDTVNKGKKVWRCSDCNKHKCRVRVVTFGNKLMAAARSGHLRHNHGSHRDKLQMRFACQRIQRRKYW